MFGRFKRASQNLAKLDNFGLSAIKLTQASEKDSALCGVIRKEALLPDELNTTDFTKEQKKKRADAIKAQQEMDEQVLSVQLDESRMVDTYDPVPEVISDYPNDPDMNEFWMIKSEGLVKSKLEIVDDHLNRAVSANYNDFLEGIRLIQEIDLELSRSDIFAQNTRRMLDESKKTITIKRRESRLKQVESIMESFREMQQVETALQTVIEQGDIIKGVEIASEMESMLMSEGLMQYTCLNAMRQRIEDLWPQLKEKLIQNIKEQLVDFDPLIYSNVFHTYSVLEAHLESMMTQKQKQQELLESNSARNSFREEKSEEKPPELQREDSNMSILRALKSKKKALKKETYVDVLQRCAVSLLTETCESALKRFLVSSKENMLPRDLIMTMGYVQLCASIKINDLPKALRCIMTSIASILHSYYCICQWHREPFAEKSFEMEHLHEMNLMDHETEEIGEEGEKSTDSWKMEDMEGISGITLLQVRRMLRTSRKSIWLASQRLVNDCLECSKIDNPNTHMTKHIIINDLCFYFMKIGEVFCGSASAELKSKLSQKQCRYIEQTHGNVLEALKNALETEMWQPFPMKLAEMNGFPGLLQSSIILSDEDNMFLKTSSPNTDRVFMIWNKEGNCFEEGKKLQLPIQKLPSIMNSIDNSLILTGVGINALIKSISKYLDFMSYLTLTADYVYAKVLNLVDYYIYAVATAFSPEALLNTLFVKTDGSETYPYIVPFIKRCQVTLFPDEVKEIDDVESVKERLTPRPDDSPELGLPQTILSIDFSLFEGYEEIHRIVAAESTRLFCALFEAINDRVNALCTISKGDIVKEYIASLSDVSQDLCKMLYRSSTYAYLTNLDSYKPVILKQKWDIRSMKSKESDYVELVKEDLQSSWSKIDTAIKEGQFTTTCVSRFWRVLMGVILEELLVSYSNVKKCSQEGREQMEFDTNAIYNLATSLCDIQLADDSKDLKYVMDYLNCCKLDQSADILSWIEKHSAVYTYEIADSIVNYAMVKKLSKQEVKDLKEAVHGVYFAEEEEEEVAES